MKCLLTVSLCLLAVYCLLGDATGEITFCGDSIYPNFTCPRAPWADRAEQRQLLPIGSAEEKSFLEGALFTSPKAADACANMKAKDTWAVVACSKANPHSSSILWLVSSKKKGFASIGEMEHFLSQLREELARAKEQLSVHACADRTFESKLSQFEVGGPISVPLGFIYIQLPGKQAPAQLWPSLTWTEVTSDYEGLLFREDNYRQAIEHGMMSDSARSVHSGRDPNWGEFPRRENLPEEASSPLSVPNDGVWGKTLHSQIAFIDDTEESGKKHFKKEFMSYHTLSDDETTIYKLFQGVKAWKRTS